VETGPEAVWGTLLRGEVNTGSHELRLQRAALVGIGSEIHMLDGGKQLGKR
jgi:hypothetical protein